MADGQLVAGISPNSGITSLGTGEGSMCRFLCWSAVALATVLLSAPRWANAQIPAAIPFAEDPKDSGLGAGRARGHRGPRYRSCRRPRCRRHRLLQQHPACRTRSLRPPRRRCRFPSSTVSMRPCTRRLKRRSTRRSKSISMRRRWPRSPRICGRRLTSLSSSTRKRWMTSGWEAIRL